MALILKETLKQFSEQILVTDLTNTILSYVNKLDYYQFRYSKENIQCISSYKDIFVTVNKSMIVNVYKNNICVDKFKIICNSKYVTSIDVQFNHIIIGTVIGELLIIEIETKKVINDFYIDCITCLKFMDEEHFIVCTMNNDIFIANINGSSSLSFYIDSYIMSINKINKDTLITGCVFGNVQYWKINFESMKLRCIKQNVKCVDSIHSIMNFNDKFIIGSCNDDKIYFANSNKILYTSNRILAIEKFNDDYFMILYSNGYLNFYDTNFNHYKSIIIEQDIIQDIIHNVNNRTKICVCEEKIFIHVDEYLYLIY